VERQPEPGNVATKPVVVCVGQCIQGIEGVLLGILAFWPIVFVGSATGGASGTEELSWLPFLMVVLTTAVLTIVVALLTGRPEARASRVVGAVFQVLIALFGLAVVSSGGDSWIIEAVVICTGGVVIYSLGLSSTARRFYSGTMT
jgi:hypothetical protein